MTIVGALTDELVRPLPQTRARRPVAVVDRGVRAYATQGVGTGRRGPVRSPRMELRILTAMSRATIAPSTDGSRLYSIAERSAQAALR